MFQPLTVNLIEMLGEDASGTTVRSLLPIIAEPSKQNDARIVVSALMGGAPVTRVDVLEPGAVVESVNEQRVRTMAELRAALRKPVRRNDETFFVLTTNDHKTVVVTVADGIASDEELAQIYRFPLSPILEKLKKDKKK